MPSFSLAGPDLKSVESELKLALTFVKISSTAYSMGRLQHATDARSKADAVRARAVAQFIESSPENAEGAKSIHSMLGEVQVALARLPSSREVSLKVRRAG